jgi:hypothetical protein
MNTDQATPGTPAQRAHEHTCERVRNLELNFFRPASNWARDSERWGDLILLY